MAENAPSETFKDFEQRGWQQVCHGYHDYFASLTQQAVAPIIDCLELRPSMRLLDVASGPGYVAAAAQARGVSVVGIDFSGEMVEKAKAAYPQITFQKGDAEALDFEPDCFQAVSMNFGLLHFEQPERALSEAVRVLAPGGKMALSVWAKQDEALAFDMVLSAIATHGDSAAPLPAGPPFFRFSEPDELTRTLAACGFAKIRIEKIPMIWRLSSPGDLFLAFFHGTPRTGGLLRAQKASDLLTIETAITDSALAYVKNGCVEIPMACLVASATKP